MLHSTTSPDRIAESRPTGENLNVGKYCLIILSLMLVFFDAQAQSGGWTRKKDLPTPRIVANASVINDKVYVIGGMDFN